MPTILNDKRITIITGHYGSGKSEFALNLAIQAKVNTLVDLDIINPYFRSREIEPLLHEKGIEVISSPLENALGSDLPFIDHRAFRPFHTDEVAIFDLGGDKNGALVLRQFEGLLGDAAFLCCINIFREETSTVPLILKMMGQIEGASGVKLTGLINNSNLLRDTTLDEVLQGQEIILEVAKLTHLPLVYTGLWEELPRDTRLAGMIIPLSLYLRKYWL
ncbi:MAG: ATP-binding protein [Bacilli bacterium]|nr:ATP-binding protein [Bacilli bacterium]